MVQHKNAQFHTKIPYPACISCRCHYLTFPLPQRNIFFQFDLNIVFLRTHRKLKWNYIDIEIYLISLWNIKCKYHFLFVMIIMSAAINKCYCYGSIVLPTSFFFLFGLLVFTVSNDTVSCCPPPWAETLHIAAAVILTQAHCFLTAAGHCYVMLGTINFVDKSINDNSVRRLDHCDIIALCSELRCATQQS